MSLEELKQKFIIDEDTFKKRIEPLVSKALEHCVVDKNGNVHIETTGLSTKDKIKLVLAARVLASQLDDNIKAATTVEELTKSSGLPKNQVRARAMDAIKDKFAESPKTGVFKALPHKIEGFLDSLSASKKPKG